MQAKRICPTHEIAHPVGGTCPYCPDPDETKPFKHAPSPWYLPDTPENRAAVKTDPYNYPTPPATYTWVEKNAYRMPNGEWRLDTRDIPNLSHRELDAVCDLLTSDGWVIDFAVTYLRWIPPNS